MLRQTAACLIVSGEAHPRAALVWACRALLCCWLACHGTPHMCRALNTKLGSQQQALDGQIHDVSELEWGEALVEECLIGPPVLQAPPHILLEITVP